MYDTELIPFFIKMTKPFPTFCVTNQFRLFMYPSESYPSQHTEQLNKEQETDNDMSFISKNHSAI